METQKLVVLDYGDLTVHYFDIFKDINIDDEYVQALGFKLTECSWMNGKHIKIIKEKGIFA